VERWDIGSILRYDLLNEPLPNQWQHVYAADLADLYRDLTAAIRQVDPHHLLVYEGSHWATNWDIFTDVWDDNSLLQFHRYRCPPERSSIDAYLRTRDKLGLPIYLLPRLGARGRRRCRVPANSRRAEPRRQKAHRPHR
jgi:hypothetical protein